MSERSVTIWNLVVGFSIVSIIAMSWHNPKLALIFFGIMASSMLWFKFFVTDEVKQKVLEWEKE